jgi:hypothetical protein
MYKTASVSTLIAIVLSSALFHGSHAWVGADSPPQGAPGNGDKGAAKDFSSSERDTGKCYPFEAVLRHHGLVETQTVGQSHPDSGKFACDIEALGRKFASVSPAGAETSSVTPTARVDATAGASISATATGSSAGVLKVPPKLFEGKILIATVPDPLETSDALEFDRAIAALQEAGSTAEYYFELMVTPWVISDLEEPKSVNEGREAQHYRRAFGDEPGALLFRCFDENTAHCKENPQLLLLLVPESPAYGLNMHAAQEALSAYTTLMKNQGRAASDPIQWIGPEYSASAESFHDLLYRPPPLFQLQSFAAYSFCILSGSVTTYEAEIRIRKANETCPRPMTDTPTLSALDLDSLDFLLSQPAFSRSDGSIAILKEDETTYGTPLPLGDSSPDNARRNSLNAKRNHNRIREFSFPRGVAHVRGIYGNVLRDATAAASAREGSGLGDPTMDFSDALQQPFDTGEEFAAQSPVSDESILASIAASLTHIDAAVIVILATDPLDQFFLARYFRRHAPDARIVLFKAERLLPRLRGDFNLDGTIVVSRFPLFQDSYLQAPEYRQRRHPLSFTNSNQEAVFLAALTQIWQRHSLYQQPFDNGEQKPAPWISVSGGGDFWPVAYQQAHSGATSTGQTSKLELEQSFLLVDTPDEALPSVWRLVLAAVLLGSTLHLMLFVTAGPLNGWIGKLPEPWGRLAQHRIQDFYFLHPFAHRGGEPDRRRRKELCLGQCWWLINVTTILFLTVSYLLLPAFVYRNKMAGVQSFCDVIHLYLYQRKLNLLDVFAMAILFGLVVLLVRLVILYLAELKSSKKDWRQKYASPVPLMASGAWTMTSLYCFSYQLVNADSGWAFSIRCLHLNSGACPILPLLLASLALLAVATGNLNLLTLPVGRYPGLPGIKWEALDLDQWRQRLNGYAEDWIQLPRPEGPLLLAGLAVSIVLFRPWKVFATFDTRCIGFLYLMTFVVCLWLVLTLSLRFFKIWSILRFGLESLEGSPLRFAFSRLPKAFSLGSIWSYAGLRRQIVLPARSLEYLRVAPTVDPQLRALSIRRAAPRLELLLTQLRDSQQTNNLLYLRFNALLNRYAVRLSQHSWVQEAWRRGGPDVISSPEAPPAGSTCSAPNKVVSTQSREDLPAPCFLEQPPEESCNVGVANEFIAVRIVMYIRFFMLHLKNMMTAISASTLLLVLAAVSYPFNEPRAILWEIASLVAFLLLIVGMVLAQMNRDPILSRLSDTDIGKLNYLTFLSQLALAGGLPALTVLAGVFPTLGNAIASLLRPVLQGLH